jgi:hypothetical protein
MQSRGRRGWLHLHWKESEREETFLHEHTTDSVAALPLQPEGRCWEFFLFLTLFKNYF